jgi:hypothetical protein
MQEALVVAIAGRRDLIGRLVQKLVIEIFDMLGVFLFGLAVGFRYADKLQE